MESGALLETVRTCAPSPLPLGLVGRFIHLPNIQRHFGIGSPKFTAHRVPHPKGTTLLTPWSSLPICSGFPHLVLCGPQKLQVTEQALNGGAEQHWDIFLPTCAPETDPCAPLMCLDMCSKHTSLTQQVSDSWRHLADLGTANLKKKNQLTQKMLKFSFPMRRAGTSFRLGKIILPLPFFLATFPKSSSVLFCKGFERNPRHQQGSRQPQLPAC